MIAFRLVVKCRFVCLFWVGVRCLSRIGGMRGYQINRAMGSYEVKGV